MIAKLIRIRFGTLISSLIVGKKNRNSTTKISKGKLVLFIMAYLYIAVIFAGIFTFMAYSLVSSFIASGFDSVYFGLFSVAAFTAIFILSIFETKSTIFEGRDNELLLSMPIPVKDIVLSRIFTVLIFNYGEIALVMGPVIVMYALFGGSTVGIIGGILVSLIIPLAATALSSGVGYLVALISARIKRKTFITVALSVLLFAGYFMGYTYVIQGIGNFATLSPEMVDDLAQNFGAFDLIGRAALLDPVPLAVMAAVALVSAFSAYKIISKSYIKIATRNTGAPKTEYKAVYLKKTPLFFALVKKEFRLFLSSANYILNAALFLVFGIILSVFVLMNKSELFGGIDMIAENIPGLANIIEPYLAVGSALILFTFSSMCTISAPALSLEGRNLWVLKSLPIPPKYILFAKVMPHFIISALVSVISSSIMIIALEISPLWWIFVILIPILGSLFGALFGAVIGALFPKFDFVSDIQVIKQSAVVGVTIISMMIIGFGTAVGGIVLMIALSPLLSGVIVISCFAVLSGLFALLLSTAMVRKLNNF